MSSSDGHGSQGNGSSNEERVVGSNDPGWLHGLLTDRKQNANTVERE